MTDKASKASAIQLVRSRIANLRPPALLLIIVLSGVAIQPYLAGQLPFSDDGKIHLFRLIEFDHALRNGVLFPRWSPDLVHGYGFPLFNYYAPAAYYPGAIFHLTGISYQSALLVTFAALVLLAGWGAYRLVDEVFGPQAALVSAASYIYAPYLALNGLHRGALGEVAGMALMPLILWAFVRLVRDESRGAFALAALSVGLLLLTHNLTSLLFAPILLAALLALWLTGLRTTRSAVLLLGAASLGLALGAVFWLPAFAERDLVQISRLFVEIEFLLPGDQFLPPAPSDPNLVMQFFPPAIGIPQAALALVAVWRLRGDTYSIFQKALVGAALGGSLLLLALTLQFSAPLWDAISLLTFVQFPWRMLGPLSLLLALLAGAAFATDNRNSPSPSGRAARLTVVASGVAVFIVALYGLRWLFTNYEPPVAAISIQDVQAFEIERNAIGTTAFIEYLPVTVNELPPSDGLTAYYAESDVITRLATQSLPDGTQVLEQSARLTWARATVESEGPFTATWNWFAFPGWRARLDGEKVAITPSVPHGLMQMQVPAGRHELEIRFGPTPLRLAASLTSLLALLAVGLIASRLPRRSEAAVRPIAFAWQSAWPLAAMLLLLVLKVGYLNQTNSIFRRTRFDGQIVSNVSVPGHVLFEDQMAYLGHDLATQTISAGDELEIAVYWTGQGSLDVDYSTSAILVDSKGNVVAQADTQHPGGLPTSRWTDEQYAIDEHVLAIPPDTPPGTYPLIISVYSFVGDGIIQLATLDDAGNPTGVRHKVAQIEVTRPDVPLDIEQLAVRERLDVSLAPSLQLVGYNIDARQHLPGETLSIELVWHALHVIKQDLLANLSLRDDSGAFVAQRDVPLVSEAYPTSAWPAGEVVRGRHMLEIPADLPGGTYTLWVAIDSGEQQSLGMLQVAPPLERVFDLPDAQVTLDETWREGIQLIGYDLTASSQALDLRLYWTTSQPLDDSYKVFVHLVDSAGEIRLQQDQIPASWQRPTTTWLPQEIISDRYTFSLDEELAPGKYILRVGLYDELTLERLLLATGTGEYIVLTEITLEGP